MANIKSQKKRILTAEKARIRNRAVRSELKTAVKAVRAAVEAGDAADAQAKAQKACGLPALYETETADRLSAGMAELTRAGDALAEAIRQVPAQNEEAMRNCRDSVLSRMFLARTAADALEGLVDRSFWPFPTYVDLLFSEG